MQEISDIIASRGNELSREDLATIDYLLTQGDADTAFERRGTVLSAIHLVVSSPDYTGDIEIEDLEVE